MSDVAGILEAAAEVEAFCRQQRWSFCFIGGLAVQRWGMPRFTQDVDLTLLADWGEEAAFVDSLLKQFSGRLANAREFALQHRVVLLRTSRGVDIDCALGALPFERRATERASGWQIGQSVVVTTCSAEDLIVHKVFAGRDRDWADVETILARQMRSLDLDLVRRELNELLPMKPDADALDRLEEKIRLVRSRKPR